MRATWDLEIYGRSVVLPREGRRGGGRGQSAVARPCDGAVGTARAGDGFETGRAGGKGIHKQTTYTYKKHAPPKQPRRKQSKHANPNASNPIKTTNTPNQTNKRNNQNRTRRCRRSPPRRRTSAQCAAPSSARCRSARSSRRSPRCAVRSLLRSCAYMCAVRVFVVGM